MNALLLTFSTTTIDLTNRLSPRIILIKTRFAREKFMSKFQGFQTMYGKFQGIEGFKLFARSKQQAIFVRHPLFKSAIYANDTY